MMRERSEAPGGGGGAGPGPGGGGAGQEDRTLYVGNLPYDVSQQEVTSLFTDNALAAPVRIHLPVGPDGRLRGFGFVTCASADAANQSLNTLRNLDVFSHIGLFSGSAPSGDLSDKERYGGVFADPAAFSKRVHLIFMSAGTAENADRAINAAKAMQDHGITTAVAYASEGTAHEWHTWRRSLHEFAPRLFK